MKISKKEKVDRVLGAKSERERRIARQIRPRRLSRGESVREKREKRMRESEVKRVKESKRRERTE